MEYTYYYSSYWRLSSMGDLDSCSFSGQKAQLSRSPMEDCSSMNYRIFRDYSPPKRTSAKWSKPGLCALYPEWQVRILQFSLAALSIKQTIAADSAAVYNVSYKLENNCRAKFPDICPPSWNKSTGLCSGSCLVGRILRCKPVDFYPASGRCQ